MPKLNRVLETALYVVDLEQAAAFYGDVLGLPCIYEDFRMRAFDVGGNGVVLLFPQGGSLQAIETPGGSIPPHDGHGPMHVAFSISADELEEWQRHLTEAGVSLEAVHNGREAGSACTSVIPTTICWRLRPLECGRGIKARAATPVRCSHPNRLLFCHHSEVSIVATQIVWV